MIFTDLKFVFFFVIVFVGRWTLRSHRFQKLWLLSASYLFYSAWDYRFLQLIVFSTAIDFVAAKQMGTTGDDQVRRRWLILSLLANLGMLGVFKYLNFFVDSAVDLVHALGWQASERSFSIILPVGISFFTFQTLSYTIDVYRRQLQPIDDPFDFALFVAFFPQLVAGPIIRAKDFLPQLKSLRCFKDVDFRFALTLFLSGFIKKACFSDNIAGLIDPVFADPSSFNWWAIWGATLGYSIQIYCDFSGYSDMAIATAALLGFDLCENFRFPYFARSIQDFWRRWHISLSTWLRDYLYIPLGGNRGSSLRATRNLLITMLLGGLWHGAAWNFVLWGALHGVALVVARKFNHAETGNSPRQCLVSFAAGLATFAFVTILWVVFRCPNLADAQTILRSLVTLDATGTRSVGYFLWGFVGVFAISHVVAYRWSPIELARRLPAPVFWFLLGAGTATALSFANRAVKPFIYFQF